MRQSVKSAVVWCVILITMVGVYHYFAGPPRIADERVTFSKLIADIQANPQTVKKLLIKGDHWSGEYADGRKFKTTGPPTVDGELLTKLNKDGKAIVPYEFEERDESSLLTLVLGSWLPMLALVFIFFMFMRQLQAGGGKAMSFGKSRHRLLGEAQPKVTFADVAGIEEAKHEVEEIIAFLKDPKKFTKLGGRIPKGVLLMGSPGTGKTLLARAIAGEANVSFFSISGSDFVEMFVGVGASRVRDLFEQGKKNAPCIIFIDEIDAVGRHRGAGLGGGHDEREQTLNQLLVEMDGFESNDGVILVAATNRPDVLDPALLRPGRFDRRIMVPRPDVKGREGVLKVHARKVPLGQEVSLETIAKATPGFSGADLESLVNEAALLAARKDKDKVDMRDFEEAKDKVMMGPERKSMVISDREKRTTAYHEAGHALVAKLIPSADPVHKVSIIPRGPALGVTQQLPQEDRLSYSKEWAETTISVMMGGRIAEELVFEQLTTGAGNDLDRATDLARRMVCEWGMSAKMGPLTFGKREEQPFWGRDQGQRIDYSQETARAIDDEIRRIVMEGYTRARLLLETNMTHLKAVAEALLEFETIGAEDIDVVLAGGKIERKIVAPTKPQLEAPKKERQPLFVPPILAEEPEKA